MEKIPQQSDIIEAEFEPVKNDKENVVSVDKLKEVLEPVRINIPDAKKESHTGVVDVTGDIMDLTGLDLPPDASSKK